MTSYCASDLHICNGRGEFAKNKQAAHDFLDKVGRDPLYLDGDTLDLWLWTMKEIMNGSNRDFINRLIDKKELFLVLGNHDLYPKAMGEIFKAPIKMFYDVDGYRVMHGHQLDPALDTAEERWLVAKGARLLQVLGLNGIGAYIAKSDRKNEPLIKALKGKPGKYILGHSHEAADLGWFVNCGCWIGERLTYVVLEDGKATLQEWRKE